MALQAEDREPVGISRAVSVYYHGIVECFVCTGGRFVTQSVSVAGKAQGEEFAVDIRALVCDRCGHIAIEGIDMPEFMRKLAGAYQLKHKRKEAGREDDAEIPARPLSGG